MCTGRGIDLKKQRERQAHHGNPRNSHFYSVACLKALWKGGVIEYEERTARPLPRSTDMTDGGESATAAAQFYFISRHSRYLMSENAQPGARLLGDPCRNWTSSLGESGSEWFTGGFKGFNTMTCLDTVRARSASSISNIQIL